PLRERGLELGSDRSPQGRHAPGDLSRLSQRSDEPFLRRGDRPARERDARQIHRFASLRTVPRRWLCHRYEQILAPTGLDNLMKYRPFTAESDTRDHLVLIGNGMAGCRAVEELLARDPARFRITIFG